jgi:hypothetical protein
MGRKHPTMIGGKRTAEYRAWSAMKTRCCNKNDKNYPNYGGRGIKVCDRWLHSFDNFMDDMGLRPKGLTLERIDNNGNYEPGNVKWATKCEQTHNRRTGWRISEEGGVRMSNGQKRRWNQLTAA